MKKCITESQSREQNNDQEQKIETFEDFMCQNLGKQQQSPTKNGWTLLKTA